MATVMQARRQIPWKRLCKGEGLRLVGERGLEPDAGAIRIQGSALSSGGAPAGGYPALQTRKLAG
jgi:hypothetical protein